MSKLLKNDHSISRYTRSKSINHNNNNQKPYQKIGRPILGHQHPSFEQIQNKSPHRRQKQNNSDLCKKCQCFKKKIKQNQEHFKSIIKIYHSEIENLKEINQSLRNQLQDIFSKEQAARRQINELKIAALENQNRKIAENKQSQEINKRKRKRQLQFCISPIQKGKQPIMIQRLSQKILLELESPTFSQLLAGTPQISKVEPQQQLEPQQKENALRAQFQRLMNQCQLASNRSKKTTIRKQMASIANQLTNFDKLHIKHNS